MSDSEQLTNIRISFVISGHRLVRFHQLAKILGFNSDTETAQYLINKGLEGSSSVIRNWEVIKEASDRTAIAQADLFRSMEEQLKQQ